MSACDWREAGYRAGRTTPIVDEEDGAALQAVTVALWAEAEQALGPATHHDLREWAGGYWQGRSERLLMLGAPR